MNKKTNLKNLKEADIKSASLFQLADYDNLKNLSQFVKEYEKAKALIAKCNEFYQSFLYSKLIPLSKLVDTYHINNIYKIESIDYKSLDEIANKLRFEAAENIKAKYEKTTPFLIYTSKNNISNISGIALKTQPDILFSYSSFNFYKWEKDDSSFDRQNAIKKYEKRLVTSSNGYFLSVKDMYEKMNTFWDTISEEFTNEVKRIVEEKVKNNAYNDLCVNIYVNNKFYENAITLLNTIEPPKNEKANAKKYKKALEDRLSESERIELNLVSFLGREKFNASIIDIFSDECAGSFHSHYISLEKEGDKLNKYIEKQLDEINTICSTIIHKYSKYAEKNEKMYIIDFKGKSHYVCNKNEMKSIKIELNTNFDPTSICGFSWGRERSDKIQSLQKFKGHSYLSCTYKEIEKYKKYRWPSDAPYVVNSTTKTIIFDVESNEAINFNENHETHEESYCRY